MPTTSPLDGLRFAFGTLTVIPVRVTRWDREAARGGMLCAPLAGLAVGAAAAGLGLVLLFLGAGAPLAAVATVAVPAVLTRGLHLDGLADTADGLGSGKPAEDALRIMKQSDVGPFGVLTLVLVLLGLLVGHDLLRAGTTVQDGVLCGRAAVGGGLVSWALHAAVPEATVERARIGRSIGSPPRAASTPGGG